MQRPNVLILFTDMQRADTEFFFDRTMDAREETNLAHVMEYGEKKKELKQELLQYLSSAGSTEAYTEDKGTLDWQPYPRVDERYLGDPDARLIFQDYPSYPLDLPGYASTT